MIQARRLLFICVLVLPCTSTEAGQIARAVPSADLPAHPRELRFASLDFTPPQREQHRHVLSNGVFAYLAEDHELPLINLSIIVRTGEYLEQPGTDGLASMTGGQMRAGGTESKTAEEFDEAADFLAAQISSFVGGTQGGASLNCLTKDLDAGLELFFDMLKHPRFQEDRLALAQSQTLQQMQRRNDSTGSIEGREWGRLIYGASHFSTRMATKASIESITREDLIAFHREHFHPGNFIFAVSGDFKTAEMLARLEAQMKDWPSTRREISEIPKPSHTPVPGVYTVHKGDVNQGRVRIGHLGSMRDNPDSHALTIMNDILGGGGFTSRIMSRVRSDEGLAYSAGSSFGLGVYYPGVFAAGFQSKNPTVAQAISIVLEEISRIRTVKVGQDELQTSINYMVEVFPRIFATAGQIAGTFAQDEFTKRPAGYWDTYRDRIRAVKTEDVLRVAQKYLDPENLVILIVGNTDEILKGNPDKPEYSILKFAKEGKVHRIPLPDPMTMVYASE